MPTIRQVLLMLSLSMKAKKDGLSHWNGQKRCTLNSLFTVPISLKALVWGDPSPPGVSIHLTAAFTSTTTTTTATIAAVSVITTTDTTTSAKTTATLAKMGKFHSVITVFIFIHITDRSTVYRSAAIKYMLSSSSLNDDDNIVETDRQSDRQVICSCTLRTSGPAFI